MRVEQLFGDLLHSGEGDPGALLDGERMVGVLKFDHGSLADGLGVDVGLEGQRRRLVARPSRPRDHFTAPLEVDGTQEPTFSPVKSMGLSAPVATTDVAKRPGGCFRVAVAHQG